MIWRVIAISSVILIWNGCAPKKVEEEKKIGKGGVPLGGIFRYAETEKLRSLFPPSITEVVGHRLASQIFEGLVMYDPITLDVLPALAKKWDVSQDGKSFIFYLREGVKFADDPCFPNGKGREVTAEDVAYCFTFLCTPHPENQMFWAVRDKIKGATAYYNSLRSKKAVSKVEGITVLDKYTIKIDLEYPIGNFLSMLAFNAFWIWPKEALEKYDKEIVRHPVGTGPFRLKLLKDGEFALLEKNPDYWRFDAHGNKLPYLDLIKVLWIKDKKTELLEFKRQPPTIDIVNKLPLEMISEILNQFSEMQAGKKNPEFQLQTTPTYTVQYYGFLQTDPLFSNKKVRLAFVKAVDKKIIVDKILQGEGIPAKYGILPEGFKDFPYGQINTKPCEYDPQEAVKLLAEAGYPRGKNFPTITLQLNAGGGNNLRVAENVITQLNKNLNIEIKIEEIPWNQHLDKIETGEAPFFRLGWVADYPDPENFLVLFYGKNVPDNPKERSYINPTRYKNAIYDAIFEKASRAIDKIERYMLYAQALQILIDDAVILPLYYEETEILLSPKVQNFYLNPLQHFYLSEVYFKEPEKKEALLYPNQK